MLPIQLIEPDQPAPQGDPCPRHLFMSDVQWPEPIGPVLRQDLPDVPRRDLFLLPPPASTGDVDGLENLEDVRSDDIFGLLVSAVVFFAALNAPPASAPLNLIAAVAGICSLVWFIFRILK